MTAKIQTGMVYNRDVRERGSWVDLARKSGLFTLFLLCFVVVLILGDNHQMTFPTNRNLYYEGATTAFFLAAALVLRRMRRFRDYWSIAYAFFVAAAVLLITSLTVDLREVLFREIGISRSTNQEMGVTKIFEATITIGTILLLTRLAGMRLESIYVKRGNLKWDLLIGLGVLFNFMTSSLMFNAARYPSLEKLGSAILWGLVFSLFNGFLEELWLRGLFLKKLIPLLGVGTSIVLASLCFGLFHVSGLMYMQPQAVLFYMVNTFTFAAAWGTLMHKTDSWIGPGLMHAASDFFLFIALLSIH
jgi:membrane protease YdiL (CAAX protease family)